jgi:hypothetical protein
VARHLRPLRADYEPEKVPFGVCDIETREWTRFLVIGFYDGKDFIAFKRLPKFLGFLFAEHERLPKRIFAHFGGKFDFLFILQTAFLLHREIEVQNLIPRGSGLLSFDLVKKVRGVEVRYTFTDSAALLPFGLEKLTSSFEVEHKKLKWDHSKTKKVTRKLLAYLRHDCQGLYQVLEKYAEWDLIQEAGAKLTMASQALQVFRLFIKKPIANLGDEEDAFVRKSYVGGRTEIFRPLHLSEKFLQGQPNIDGLLKRTYPSASKPLHCYDVNSLYPFSMLGEFPNFPQNFTRHYFPHRMGFYDVTVEVPEMWIPPLGTVAKIGKSEKFIFPTGIFRGTWSTLELEYARTLGVKILKVHRGLLFHSGGEIFRPYIEKLYAMRLEAQAKKDPVGDVLTKLLMNSLYGRMGLNRERENLVLMPTPGKESELYSQIETPDGVVQLFKEGKFLEDSFSNVAIAAWVTSRSRVHMHKIYMSCGKDLYYTDTDSLFTTREIPTGNQLGQLKLEYSREAACFLLPKTYITESDDLKKVVMKGFEKKKCAFFTMADFVSALEGDLRGLKTTIDPRISTFRKALQQKKLVTMLPTQPRAIRSLYDKRIIYRDEAGAYQSKPLTLNQLES